MGLKHRLEEVVDKQVMCVVSRWKDVFTAETSCEKSIAALVHVIAMSATMGACLNG